MINACDDTDRLFVVQRRYLQPGTYLQIRISQIVASGKKRRYFYFLAVRPCTSTMREIETQKVLQDEQCFEIVRKKLRQDAMDDFSLVDYKIVPIEEVNGFLGQYFMLEAIVACSKSTLETRSINFFIKIPPPVSSPQYDFMQLSGCFKKEVALYTTVFPEILDDLDKRCIPRCFFGMENDVIVHTAVTR